MAVTHDDLNAAPAAPQETGEPTASAPHEDEYDGYAPPTGAFLFVVVMLIAYGIYWLLTYAEIVVARNGS